MAEKKNRKANALAKGIEFLEKDVKGSGLKEEVTSVFETRTESEVVSREEVSEFTASAFGRNLTKIYSLEAGQVCPRCKYSVLEKAESFSGAECEFFLYCDTCNAYICNYQPMAHQAVFHKDEHRKKLYAGGFGSAKTYTCGMEFLCTVLQIPGSAGLVGAATWGQVADTCLKFLTDNLPLGLVAKSNQDKVNWSVTLVNGSKISAKPLDKEGKIRSANLSIIWVEEASEVKYSVVAYIYARLRNKAGYFKGKNRLKMLLSSNPDVGWLNSEHLMVSSEIIYHGGVEDRYVVDAERLDPAVSTHIAATSANVYLPEDYEANLAKNKEKWWVDRYLKGSFKYTEGLVYPSFSDWLVEPFTIPPHWRRITGTDFGRRDPTAHVVAALDPVNRIIYIYDEIEEPLNDHSLDYMVEKIKKVNSYNQSLLAFPHMCDPRGRNKDQVSGKSWISAYAEKGIYFSVAEGCEGDSLAPTIQKVSNYAKHGRLKIFNTCIKLKDSFRKYKYPARDIGDSGNQGEKPVDANNHLPDAVRYMLSVFPQFPDSVEDFSNTWYEVMNKTKKVGLANGWDSMDSSNGFIIDSLDNFG